MVICDFTRILQLDDVADRISKLNQKVLTCKLHVTAGPDSATGFTHYNPTGFLKEDDSLLSEHFMSLLLVSERGEDIWRNPSPQSDSFCRIRSMNWTKETNSLNKSMFEQFFAEVDSLNLDPVEVISGDVRVCVYISAMYTMIDGKAANAIVGNQDTHVCPLCVPNADPHIGPLFFHSRLNAVEWLIKNAAKKSVPDHPAYTNPLVKKKAREIADELEREYGMNINRPKIGGSGSCNNGNMAHHLLAEPGKFAKIIGVHKDLVENLRLISCLALSSRVLDPTKVMELYNTLEKQIFNEFPYLMKLPPSIHKYMHLANFIEKLISLDLIPYTMNFVDEQSGERCHKVYKFIRPHLARKTSPEENLTDMMTETLTRSDPKLACFFNQSRQSRSTDARFEERLDEYTLKQDDSDENHGKADDSGELIEESDEEDDDPGELNEESDEEDI
ncbi:uncharacterized protein LOC135710388 [Ochlerotatus camptorhynchus]|uniref:uncharacterized protein LOC135710388 n=1 Tax=Ochlerotatus camptorhynchus TaxID=644619 RepID=UPI0031E335BF